MFVQWPEHAVWNTRFLPFWLLTWGFLAAMGATEILRWWRPVVRGRTRGSATATCRTRARQGVGRVATVDETPDVDPECARKRRGARRAGASTTGPPGWEPPAALRRERIERSRPPDRRRSRSPCSSASPARGRLHRAWERAQRQPEHRDPAAGPRGTTRATSSKPAWPEYTAIMKTMGTPAARDARCGSRRRGELDRSTATARRLALELLPYFTKGRIGSMEGLYFESSATTVVPLPHRERAARQHPSNPVRGLVYGVGRDRLRPRREAPADARRPLLDAVDAGEPRRRPTQNPISRSSRRFADSRRSPTPKGWKVYEVADSDPARRDCDYEPVVAQGCTAGTYS